MINLVGDVKPALLLEAHELLKRFGCAHLADSRWGVLSQGERQKILICRAMMTKFQVLILDEPCAGLDPVAREYFLAWLQSFAAVKSAPSLVLVTHHVEEIMPCFNRVLLMKDGKILANGVKGRVLASAKLSQAYGAKLKLSCSKDRYRLKII
jgi:iron complex transport system ATP-binding protein